MTVCAAVATAHISVYSIMSADVPDHRGGADVEVGQGDGAVDVARQRLRRHAFQRRVKLGARQLAGLGQDRLLA